MIFTPQAEINIQEMKNKNFEVKIFKPIMTQKEIEAIEPDVELGTHTEQCCRIVEVLGGEIIKEYDHPFYYSRGIVKFKNWNKEILTMIIKRK